MTLEVGAILDGKVTGLTNFGAFVELPGGKTGMVHISEVANTYVKEIRDFVKENEMVKVKVLNIGDDGKVSLSMKQAVERPVAPPPPRRSPGGGRNNSGGGRPDNFEWQSRRGAASHDSMSFEEMMSKFKQTSDEKLSDLKKVTESKHGGFSRRGGGQSK